MLNAKTAEKKSTRPFLILALLIITIIITSCLMLLKNWSDHTISFQKTESVEEKRTIQYAAIARSAIQDFEMNRKSLNIYVDPQYKTKVYIGPILDLEESLLQDIEKEPFWTVANEVNIINLRVVEYNSEKMRVIACLDLKTSEVDHRGKFVKELPSRQFQGAYVFLFDENLWKLANFLDVTDPKRALRDWDAMSGNLKEITGDINTLVYKSCEVDQR